MNTPIISESARQRITMTLFASQSLYSAATIMTFTLLPIVASDLGGSDSLAGFPSTATLIGKAASAYFVGWLMDKVGRRIGLSLGSGLGLLGALLAAVSIIYGSFIGLILSMLLLGMGRGAIDLGRFAAAEVYTEDRRAQVIGLVVFGGTVGAIGGPLLVPYTGNLVEQMGLSRFTGPYFMAAIFLLMGLVLLFAFLRPDPLQIGRLLMAQQEAEGKVEKARPQRPLREIFANGRVQVAVASMTIGQLVMTMLMTITPLYMNHHDHGEGAISGVIMAHTIGMFGLSGVTGWLADRFGRMAVIVGGGVILLISSVMAPAVTGAVPLGIALFLLGLGWNFCFVGGSSLLTDALRANERSQIQGASDTMVSLASGLGNVSTGFLFAQWGIIANGSVGLVLALLLLTAVVWQRKGATVAYENLKSGD
ncbi:MAG: MFS transporter [Ardenticatenaceae bacterium]|nr:MFS transporter [Ardenticatenaceae bacterium]